MLADLLGQDEGHLVLAGGLHQGVGEGAVVFGQPAGGEHRLVLDVGQRPVHRPRHLLVRVEQILVDLGSLLGSECGDVARVGADHHAVLERLLGRDQRRGDVAVPTQQVVVPHPAQSLAFLDLSRFSTLGEDFTVVHAERKGLKNSNK